MYDGSVFKINHLSFYCKRTIVRVINTNLYFVELLFCIVFLYRTCMLYILRTQITSIFEVQSFLRPFINLVREQNIYFSNSGSLLSTGGVPGWQSARLAVQNSRTNLCQFGPLPVSSWCPYIWVKRLFCYGSSYIPVTSVFLYNGRHTDGVGSVSECNYWVGTGTESQTGLHWTGHGI